LRVDGDGRRGDDDERRQSQGRPERSSFVCKPHLIAEVCLCTTSIK
jgi:hypothetical protein